MYKIFKLPVEVIFLAINNAKNPKVLLLTVLVISVITFGCQFRQPIKIGFAADLTGLSSELGVSSRYAVEMAVDEINDNGGINGRPIELIVHNISGGSENFAKFYEECAKAGVKVIIGPCRSQALDYSLLQDDRVLIISPTVSTDSVSSKDDNFIRIIPSSKNQSQLLATAVDKEGIKNVAFIFDKDNIPYTSDIEKFFTEYYRSLGGRVVSTFSYSKQNSFQFKEIISEINNLDIEALVFSMNAVDSAMLIQQLKMKNWQGQSFGSIWAMTDDFLKNGGSRVEGVYLSGAYDKYSGNKELQLFKGKYISRYSTNPTFASIYSYEAIQVLREALLNTGKISPKAIKESIIKIKNFAGLQENFYIDEFGDAQRDYFLIQVQNGEFKRVD